MLKKIDITEKLKKLSGEGEKKAPLLKPKRVSELADAGEEKPGEAPPEAPGRAMEEVVPGAADGGEQSMARFLLTEEDIGKSRTRYKGVEEDKLEQVLDVGEKDPAEIKWTVNKDPFAEEFSMLSRELRLVKTSPPIYAAEFGSAGVVSSHIGLYTLTMGGFGMEIEKLIETFTSVLKSKGLI
ncbi:MAG: hypothetical protein GXO65_03775 [Euryarchaeota archaeon]|nr:hypothetical protein [Euryarchaeota archaeon]